MTLPKTESAEKSMCKCISYNRPDFEGSDTEVILKAPSWSERKTICIDACIADDIQRLWDNGIVTLGCCCGHNRSRPSVILEATANNEQVKLAQSLLPKYFQILQWILMDAITLTPSK